MPDSPIFSATSTRGSARPWSSPAAPAAHDRSRTQSMQAVSARTSAGSVAGNIATRS